MTQILGLKSNRNIIIAAESEESAGIVSKRSVAKIALYSGDNWIVAVAGAGNAMAAESAMRKIGHLLKNEDRPITQGRLEEIFDEALRVVRAKYIDPDPVGSGGLALIGGAVCDGILHLISSSGAASHFHESTPYVYAGVADDLCIYFLERADFKSWNWKQCSLLAASVLKEVKESIKDCGGPSELFVLQVKTPRWRKLSGWYLEALEVNEIPTLSEAVQKYMETLRRSRPAVHMGKWIKDEIDGEGYEEERRPRGRRPAFQSKHS